MSMVIREGLGEDDFDEEAAERDEFYIEQLVQEFIDVPSIRHDEIPESEDEEEENEAPPRRRRTDIRRGDGRLYKGQSFFNGVAFKEFVLDYALRTGRNLKQYRYDKEKIGFRCVGSGGCTWKIYASTLPKEPLWKVRIFIDKHICVPNGECEMLKVPQIARLFLDKIREEPEYFLPMKIEETVKVRWQITVSRHQCQAARKKALRWIETEHDLQFARLRDYAAEIVVSNPNSSVQVETILNEEGKDEFNKFYICFDQLRRTWKNTCRPIIGVDGCFLKHKIKGQLLVAVGRDADNAMYPIAWGVVQVENTPNWLWFVQKLKVDLALNDGDGYILVSDRQKGLIKAVENELPKIEHIMCVRHIYANLKKNHGSKKQMKPLIWNLAWSYNSAEYEERLDKLRNYDIGVYNDVMRSQPKTWCRAFYRLGNYCEDVENNTTEAFNSTINKAREKPFVPMLETIRRLAMARIAKRSYTANIHKSICTPYVTTFLAAEYKRASDCVINRSTNGFYEARLSGCAYRVNLNNRTCTCMKYDITGIPCAHAYGVIMTRKLHPEDYVCHWFRTTMWRRNYEEGLVPVRGAPFWPSVNEPKVHIPPPPPQPGRKKVTKADKKRKLGVNESPTKKQAKHKKRTMHCKICGQADHNSRFHKREASQGESSHAQADSSQGILTQGSQVEASHAQADSSQDILTQASQIME